MNKGALFGIGAVVVVTALLVLNLRSLVSDMSNKSPKIITASIKLVNKFSMSDDAFVLKDVKTGKSTTFINGIARIDVLEGSSLQVIPPFVGLFETRITRPIYTGSVS